MGGRAGQAQRVCIGNRSENDKGTTQVSQGAWQGTLDLGDSGKWRSISSTQTAPGKLHIQNSKSTWTLPLGLCSGHSLCCGHSATFLELFQLFFVSQLQKNLGDPVLVQPARHQPLSWPVRLRRVFTCSPLTRAQTLTTCKLPCACLVPLVSSVPGTQF